MLTKDEKEMIRAEFKKVWPISEKMVKFCTDKTAAFAELPGGELVTVEKQSIETRFCFGESGYDYDDAQRAAAHARKSESYFKSENMKHFRELIADLQAVLDGSSNYVLTVSVNGHYYSQSPDCRLQSINLVSLWKVLEALGGSAYIEDLPGTVIGSGCYASRVATKEEVAAILEAYKKAAADHEKKVDAYLKRYGTSKVNAWTYWRDA